MKQSLRPDVIKPPQIFLLDGVGAIVSAFSLGVLLVHFNIYIGMPIKWLYLLASLACCFAFYSLGCYYLKPNNWRSFLKGIATLNILYCLLSLALMSYFFNQLTLIGISYFIVEKAIVLSLAFIEFKVALAN